MFSFLRKVRSFHWITSGFFGKHKRLIISSAVIGVGSFLFITKILPLMLPILPIPKPTEKIGLVGRYTWESLPELILDHVTIGLTTVSSNGTAVPGLAEKWEISNDGKLYIFTLRDNLFWQDETTLKAGDLKYGLTDVEIKTPSDKVIQFQLKEPFAPFPLVLTKPVFKNSTIGTGNFKIGKITKKGDLIEQIYLIGEEKNIVYKIYPNSQVALTAFKLGEINVVEGLFEMPLDSHWQQSLKIEKRVNKDQYIGLFFNWRDPTVGDKAKAIRQALAYAIKKDFDKERAIGPLSPNSWAFNRDLKLYDYDAEKATELFEKSPSEEEEATGSAQVEEKPENENTSLKIRTIQGLLPVAEKIRNDWQETLGLEVTVETINFLADDFQILLIGQEIPADPDQYPLWHSTQEQNFTHYQSPKVDKLLEDGRRLMDQAQRKEKYYDFQKFLVEDVPVIFLYHPEIYKVNRH